MFNFNLTIAIQMVSFLVFVFLMNRLFFRPIVRAIEARQAYLLEQQQKASESLKETESLQRDYEARLKHAREEAQAIVQAATAEAEAKRREALATASAEAAVVLDAARGEIAAERDKALESLRGEVAAIAGSISAKVMEAAPAVSRKGA
jgi:F-type H+-transporting ATPase subunit b